MSAIGDLTELLMLRGCPPDVVKTAVDLAQLHARESAEIHPTSGGHPVDSAAEKRRAYDRERQRIKRDKLKNVSLDSSLLPSSEVSLEKKEEVVVARESKPRASGHRLPEDWKPNAGHYAAGKTDLGYPDDASIDEKAQDMRIWANTNGHRAVARKSDWDLTFLGWLRREKPKCAIINGYAPRPGSLEDRRERTHNAYQRLSDYAENGPDVTTGCSDAGQETSPQLRLVEPS